MKKKETKVKQENLFKRWYKLCEPNKKMWFFQVAFYIAYAVIYTLMTIFAAKTINCLVEQNYKGAFFWLVIEFLDILLRNLCLHIQYVFYGNHYAVILKNITTKIYNKLFLSEEKGLKRLTTEKIINIAQNNMGYAAEFPDYVAYIVRYIVQVIIALVTIFISNVYAGLIVIVLGVINFFVYNFFNKKLGHLMQKRHEKKDLSFQEYSKIISGKPVIEELNATDIYKEKLLNYIDDYSKEYKKYYLTNSCRDNIYYTIWNVVVYAITALLIFLVSKGTMELAVYLVIVPYLTSCITELNSLYSKFGGVENMRVDVDRINMILSLSDKQLVQYGNVNKTADGYNLGFIDVSHNSPETNIKLSNVDISFKMHGINIVKGEHDSGKRILFNLLRRRIRPDKGTVMLDNLNLFDYNERTFKSHIDYCSAHPYFLKGTVKENLLVANKDFSAIETIVEKFGIQDVIKNLPQGYDTPISDIQNGETRFWIGLIRAALSKCKILMIYEYPDDVSDDFHILLKNIISTSENDKRTLIFFTHKNDYDNLADLMYEIKNGKVKMVKATKNTKSKS